MTNGWFIVCIVALAVLSTLCVCLFVACRHLRKRADQAEQAQHDLRRRISELEVERSKFEPEPEPEPEPEHVPTHGELFMLKLNEVLDKHLDNNTLSVNDLVDEMGMGRTVFFNRLKSITGLSPVEYIRERRLQRAAQMLENSRYNITEITYMVGMNDSRYFSRCFRHSFGVTPTEYRRRKGIK